MCDRIRALPLLTFLLLLPGCGPSETVIVERQALKGHERDIVDLVFDPVGDTLASRDGEAVKIWGVKPGIERFEFTQDGAEFGSIAFAPNFRFLTMTRAGKGVITRDLWLRAEDVIRDFPPGPAPTKNASTAYGWGLAYSPDGKFLAGGGSLGEEDGFLAIWGEETGEGVIAMPRLTRPITSVAYSPDGKTIATGSMDGKIVLWNSAERQERLTIDANRSYLAPVVFSTDGKWVVSSNEARYIRIWDVATGKDVATLKGHLKAVLSLAFRPDGKLFVTGDSSGTLFVWDTSTLKPRSIIECKDRGKVWRLAFSPNGKTLASAGEDRLIHLWDVVVP